jgi:hypothetical protein
MTLKASSLMDTVDEMLLEAGQEQDTELRAALLSLATLGSLPAPPPNAQLAALLGSRPAGLSLRRWMRRHRPAIVGLTVVAGMGLGVTGVAASASRPAEQGSASIQHLLEEWAPAWNVSGLPAAAPTPGLLPEPAPAAKDAATDFRTPDGQPETPVRGPAGQAARPDTPAGTTGEGSHDAGAGARDTPGSAAAGTVSADKEPADKKPRVPSEGGTLPDNADESVRQALAETGKLLSGAIPENAVPEEALPGTAVPKEPGKGSAKPGAGKKADPGAKWLKKFSR